MVELGQQGDREFPVCQMTDPVSTNDVTGLPDRAKSLSRSMKPLVVVSSGTGLLNAVLMYVGY